MTRHVSQKDLARNRPSCENKNSANVRISEYLPRPFRTKGGVGEKTLNIRGLQYDRFNLAYP